MRLWPKTSRGTARLRIIEGCLLLAVAGLGASCRACGPSLPEGMVVVEGGPFLRGCDPAADPLCNPEERPQRSVYVSRFAIGRTEVTRAEWAACVRAGACPEVGSRGDGAPDVAVTGVRWDDAQRYCAWKKGRLPTEAEWEKAARGTDGRIYPWGSAAPDCELASYAQCPTYPRPAGSLPRGASPYGVLDMAGGVEEWTADWYDPNYFAAAPDRDPPGPATGHERTLRGGAYDPWHIRVTARNWLTPDGRDPQVGFRCVVTDAP